MATAIASAERVAVPLNTRCSMRWEIPPRSSGSAREPVSTQMPTATERTCGIASVTTRTPFGRMSLRQATRLPGRLGRRDRQLFSLGHRRLILERNLARQSDLPVRVDLDHLDRNHVVLAQDVRHGPDARVRDLGDVEQPLGAWHDLDEGAELLDALHLAEIDTVQLSFPADVLDDVDGHLRGLAAGREDRDLAV